MLSYIANIFPNNWITSEIGTFCRHFMSEDPHFSSIYLYKNIPGSGSFMSVDVSCITLMPGFRYLSRTTDGIPKDSILNVKKMLEQTCATFFPKEQDIFKKNIQKWLKMNTSYNYYNAI